MTKQIEKSRVQEITQLHDEIGGYLKMSLEKAIKIGELLTEQKASLKHGEWLPWIESNLPFSTRTAEVYLKCYREREKIAESANLRDALSLLVVSKRPALPEKTETDLSDRINQLAQEEKRLLRLQNEIFQERVELMQEAGKLCEEHEDRQNLHKRNHELLIESDLLLEAETFDLDRADELSAEWDKVFQWAGKYYPKFECFLQPNPYLGMGIKELMAELEKTFNLPPKSPYEWTPIGLKNKKESSKDEWLEMSQRLKEAGEILGIAKRKTRRPPDNQ